MTLRHGTLAGWLAYVSLACASLGCSSDGAPAGASGAGNDALGGGGMGRAGTAGRAAGGGGIGGIGGLPANGGSSGTGTSAGTGGSAAGTTSTGGGSAGSGAMAGGAAGREASAGSGTEGGRAGEGENGGTGGRGGNAAGGSAGTGEGGAAPAGAGGMPGAAGASTAGAGSISTPLTVYLAGDSTVSTYKDTASTTDQAGWGQMLGALFGSGVTVDNRAVGGSTARRFIDEGHFDDLFGDIQAGDYVLVQFGTNDGNKTATYEHDGETIPYYLDPATDFKTYLTKYIDAASQHQATIAFVTPPPRNSAYCTGGNGTGGHADAMRQLGMDKSVAVLDLNKRSVDYLKAICPSPTPEDFFLLRSDMTVDGTHFQENGARILASFVADEMKRVSLPLSTLLE